VAQQTDWYYVQARLQARFGDRLQESDWLALEAAKSLDRYLERARSTSMRRFTEHLSAQLDSHAIERALRADWRLYVREVAAWTPPVWEPAVMWVAYVPDISVLEHLLAGHTPDWARDDPVYASLASVETPVRGARLVDTPLSPLASPHDPTTTLGDRWLSHWRALWPRTRERRWLDHLVALVVSHRARLIRAGASDTSSHHRADLGHAVVRLFRRRSATPVALLCTLLLLALDLERLRGGLVRRRLFVSMKEST
jgi:hypothetical protein